MSEIPQWTTKPFTLVFKSKVLTPCNVAIISEYGNSLNLIGLTRKAGYPFHIYGQSRIPMPEFLGINLNIGSSLTQEQLDSLIQLADRIEAN